MSLELPSLVSKARLIRASAAALLGCAACCAVPFLAAAGFGGGAAATLARVIRPGSEILVGAAVFLAALASMAIFGARRRGCGESCKADGTCCGKGAGEAP